MIVTTATHKIIIITIFYRSKSQENLNQKRYNLTDWFLCFRNFRVRNNSAWCLEVYREATSTVTLFVDFNDFSGLTATEVDVDETPASPPCIHWTFHLTISWWLGDLPQMVFVLLEFRVKRRLNNRRFTHLLEAYNHTSGGTMAANHITQRLSFENWISLLQRKPLTF